MYVCSSNCRQMSMAAVRSQAAEWQMKRGMIQKTLSDRTKNLNLILKMMKSKRRSLSWEQGTQGWGVSWKSGRLGRWE